MIKLIKEFFKHRELILTIEHAREYYHPHGFVAYDGGDYAYKCNDQWSLISNDQLSFKSLHKPIAMERHVYIYQTKNLKWTLVINGKIVIENADEVWRNQPGIYIYEIDNKEYTVKKTNT